MRRLLVLLLSFLPLFTVSCNLIEIEQRHLVVASSPSLAPLVRDIAVRFQGRHLGVRVDVALTNVDHVIAETREGLIDVAVLGRALRANDGLRGAAIARDGLAFIVHPSNPVPALDERQLIGLLTRSYTSWSEVGGSAGPIVVVGVAEGRALRTSLLQRFQLDSGKLPLDQPLYRNEQVFDAVAHNPQALGYVSLAEALQSPSSVRLLPQGGGSATVENLRNERYPYARPLVLATRLQANELATAFIEFSASAEVYDLIEQHGFVSMQPAK